MTHSSAAPSRPLKVAITGVSRGLGKALTEALACRGVQVFGCSLYPVPAAADPRPAPGYVAPVIVTASVTSPSDMASFARLACEGGAPDAVIANAGLIHERRPVWEIPASTWQEVLSVNLAGVALTAQVFLPEMMKADAGLFIAISSGWGRHAAKGLGPYCASKFGVEGLVGCLNHELPPHLRAIALDPGGGVNTEMLAACLPDEHQEYISPAAWAECAAAYLLTGLLPGDVRGSCTVPHHGKH